MRKPPSRAMEVFNNKKAFKALFFPGTKESAVVFRTWLQKHNKNTFKCWWPTSGNPEQLALDKVSPGKDWASFICLIKASGSK